MINTIASQISVKHGENPKEYFRLYRQKSRELRRTKAIEYLGGKCVKCGSKDSLEFDHINPDTVSFRLGGDTIRLKWERVLRELQKCQLLCRPCHRAKTNLDNGFSEPTHGTASMYSNQRCRCAECCVANTLYARAYRARLTTEQTKDTKWPQQ